MLPAEAGVAMKGALRARLRREFPRRAHASGGAIYGRGPWFESNTTSLLVQSGPVVCR
jgi:hypothetical protein